MSRKKFLFIAHDASRSGGPLVLLSFLQWLKKSSEIPFDILLLKDGPVRKDFEDIATTHFIPFAYKYSLVNKVRRRIHPELSDDYKIEEVVKKLSKKNFTVVFGNTIVTLPWLIQFKKLTAAKTVCSIHELTNVIEFYFEKKYVVNELGKIDQLVAGSEAVKVNLAEEFNMPYDKIKVIHAFINTDNIIHKNSGELRAQLGIKENEIIIGGMSMVDLRKGTDLIVPLVMEIKEKYPRVLFKFIWVGGKVSENFLQIVKRDAKKCGVEDNILFIENTPYPNDYINLYDVFILLSREDPFPLVLLTAASMEKAVLAFKKSGGAEELLGDGAGFLASYLKIGEMAGIIANLYQDRNLIKEAGKKAKEKVAQKFSEEIIPPKILKILEDL